MAKTVLLDGLFVTVRVPADLPDAEAEAARRTLAGGDLLGRLRRAVRGVIRESPELARVRVTVTR